MNIINSIFHMFQNSVLNSLGVERSLLELIQAADIDQAKALMQDRDLEVREAIKEYNPESHDVNRRANKFRNGKEPYYTEKLPRGRQRYINEVELFFLLGQPIIWKATSDDTDNAFRAYSQFLKETRFNSSMREAKRRAGAETECAKIYHIYKEDGEARVKVKVISHSTGYTLRPLFDQWDNLVAFGYGYYLNENGSNVEHFDIETPGFIYRCKLGRFGWEVTPVVNPTGKINVIYYRQEKAWAGVQRRIDREEYVDSKAADTNNYFADPKLKATADVLENMTGGGTNNVGEVIQLTDKERSSIEYLSPPEYSSMKDSEKKDLAQSILFDTFTPDFSYENMKGLGTLSGEAMRRAMALGYMKRDNLKETYDELVDREKNLILAIMMNVTHIEMREELSRLIVEHEFAEPFAEDKDKNINTVATLYDSGLVSLPTAVEMLSLTDKPEEEIRRILDEKSGYNGQNNNNQKIDEYGNNNSE